MGQVRTNGGLDYSDSWGNRDSSREGNLFWSLLIIGRCPPCSNRHIMKALADISENVCSQPLSLEKVVETNKGCTHSLQCMTYG